MRSAFAAGLFALVVVHAPIASASDLGHAGPFRSLGGRACPAGTPDGCTPPAVDAALPRDRQVRGHVDRALAFFDLLRMTDARAELDEALRLAPDDLQALTLRGRLNLGGPKADGARADLEHALSIAPTDPYLLASFAAFEPYVQAEKDFTSALEQKPDDTDILFAKVRYELDCGCYAQAYVDLSRILAIAPGDERARHLRAEVGLRRHAYNLAVVDANQILAVHPQDLKVLQIKAAARLGAGDDAGAIETYTDLLATPDALHGIPLPEVHDALVARGRLLAKQRRFDEARRDLDALVREQGVQALLQLQLYLQGHGYPNVEISGKHTAAFDTALNACFGDTVCGPNLFR